MSIDNNMTGCKNVLALQSMINWDGSNSQHRNLTVFSLFTQHTVNHPLSCHAVNTSAEVRTSQMGSKVASLLRYIPLTFHHEGIPFSWKWNCILQTLHRNTAYYQQHTIHVHSVYKFYSPL